MVPEFMHRDFYRSQEELDAVQTKTRLKPNKPTPAPSSGGFQGVPLRSAGGQRSTTPAEEKPLPEETVAVPLEALRTPKPEPGESPLTEPAESAVPRPVQTRSLNIPLVLCLLFVVGLFLWREQTRPPVLAEPEIPLTQEVKVAEKVPESGSVLGEDNPYPAMVPDEADTQAREPVEESPERASTEVAGEEALPIPDFPGEETVETAELPSDSEEPIPDAVTYPQRERAVQRAAILERVSDRTVNRNERDRRMERELRDDSLFPETVPESIPDPVPPAQTEPPAEATTESAGDESLFPEEPAEAASEPAELPADPLPVAVPPSSTQPVSAPSDITPSYQIDEPDL